MAKCSKCDATITSLTIQVLTFQVGSTDAYGGRSYCCCCPSCDAVLGAEIDQADLKTEFMRAFLDTGKKAKT